MRSLLLAVMTLALTAPAARTQAAEKELPWHLTADYIEACSCNLFCACYFNPSPDKDFCEFNKVMSV